jgi:hypothetical protein
MFFLSLRMLVFPVLFTIVESWTVNIYFFNTENTI